MGLIIYPASNYDSFISVAGADSAIATHTLDSDSWMLLSDNDKEILLRIAFRHVVDNSNVLNMSIPSCLPTAQALMASHDNVNSISGGTTSTATTGAIKKQKVGPITREFYDVQGAVKNTNLSRIPDSVKACMIEIGYALPSSGQVRLGRS